MLKNRNTISYNKIQKRPIRPQSSGTYFQRKPRSSLQINHIIDSLQKNVKDLKHYCNKKQQIDKVVLSHDKSKKGFRTRKIIQRNSSQSNLQKQVSDKNEQKIEDKSLTDIFEIKSFYLKVNGKETNNIIELYEFYKKNIEKREKSTRIMASIDMSYPNMGLSIDVGKQSLLRQDIALNNKKQLIQTSKIQEKQEDISRQQSIQKISMKKIEKPSQLATELLSKGYYNLSNVANLLNNKKYKLTREKQESFKMHQLVKEKIISAKDHQRQANKENNQNLNNKNIKQVKKEEINQLNQALPKLTKIIEQQKVRSANRSELSFKQTQQQQSSNKKKIGQQSFIPSSKNVMERNPSRQKLPETKEQLLANKKSNKNNLQDLLESPIIKKNKQFKESKYYVQPIPKKTIGLQDEQSITLKSDSRIIDLDLFPFDL